MEEAREIRADLEDTLTPFYKVTLSQSPQTGSETTWLLYRVPAWFAFTANLLLTEFCKPPL